MKTLGLDLSTTETGYCIYDGTFKTGRIKPKSTIPRDNRICLIVNSIRDLIVLNNIDTVVIEEIYLNYATSAMVLGRLQGAVIYMLKDRYQLEPVFYDCSHARKNVGLNGHAKKEEVCSFVSKKLNLTIFNDNEADAVVVVLNHLKEIGVSCG